MAMSIQIVEDNPITSRIIQSLVVRYFKSHNLPSPRFDITSSSTNALYLIEQNQYDIIFLDNQLQKGEPLGSDIARQARNMNHPQAIMISMTAYEKMKPEEGLFDVCLEKPIDYAVLEASLDKIRAYTHKF